jgi:hypothetical protein
MIDDLLIHRVFSPLTGWVEDRFGVNQWRLSFECLNGCIVFYLAGVALSIAGKGLADGIFIDMIKGLVWLFIMDFARRVARRQAGSSIGVQSARLNEWVIRLILVCLLPVILLYIRNGASLCVAIALVLLVAHMYFKASDSPPPRPRRKLVHAKVRA